MKDATIEDLRGEAGELQRLRLDLVRDLDRIRRGEASPAGASLPGGPLPDAVLDARIASFEPAFRMQTEVPGLLDLSGETLRLYGIGEMPTEDFGRQCLLARRLAEAGVRFVQCSHASWDQHSELKAKHAELAAACDRPIAGPLADLKRRGLLDDTLVIWGGEFGRTPTAHGGDGRDHNPHAFTWWMAGGGTKPGISYGTSDEYGYYAVEDKVHVHDLHATVLHLLGLDHERLTYRHAGRDFRLTDVHGRVVEEILDGAADGRRA